MRGWPHIHYVFMRFPVSSETFARVEVCGLREAGCYVSASTLRSPDPRASDLLREHGLEKLQISHGGVIKWFQGLSGVFWHPLAAWQVVRQLLSGIIKKPKESLVGLMILPRAFGIALEAKRQGADHVHLFWGHYPSLVGLALKAMDQEYSVSMFLGAYDLVREFPPSRLLAHRVPITTHARVNVPIICSFTGVEPDKVEVIYRGIQVPPCPSLDTHPAYPNIVVAERFVAAKRTSEAIDVFARVIRKFPDAILTLLGDGPERLRLEQLIREYRIGNSVRVRGHVTHNEVQTEMARAHIFLSMSQSPGERLPNAAKEAMAACCAVVITRTPGIEELVVEGEMGYIVGPSAIEEATVRLIELLSDGERIKRFGQLAHKQVASAFNIASTTQKRLLFWNPNFLISSNID